MCLDLLPRSRLAVVIPIEASRPDAPDDYTPERGMTRLASDHRVPYNLSMEAEHVFKALADQHRRHLQDTLSRNDGQTLGELCTNLLA